MDFKRIQEEFLEIYYELAYGFQSKDQEYNKNKSSKRDMEIEGNNTLNQKKYIKDDYLVHALNRFSAFALKYNMLDDEGRIIAPTDETDAIENWFNVPVGSGWKIGQEI